MKNELWLQIVNDNKLIAEFMEWKIDNSFPDKDKVYRLGKRIELGNTFKFHSSFEWLMPVVEKIESLGYEVSIISNECEIGTEGYKYTQISLVKDDNKLRCVYKAVVEFINYYNK